MSFVHQAGQNPRQIFFLNAMFCLGMISVFLVLAFFAVQFGLGWGQQFEGLTFKVIMIAVVVVFGLSFFGVWEIPLPGFGGGGMDQKEGLFGAFSKGILTTLLATPCSGPMLIPVVVWGIAQPAMVTYLVFLALGLGMGAPYLVIGMYPKLVSKLPKPGPWMETFKRLMGFIMLGTAVFLMGAIEHKYVVSVLTLLVILAFACWWMGRTSLAAPLPQRIKAWSVSIAISVFAVWFSFFFLISPHELQYQPFTRLTLEENLEEGRTEFVDFTADW
jgi:thiol:disulfide interchange protein